MVKTVRATNIAGEYIASAQWIGSEMSGYYLAADQAHPGALIMQPDLYSLVSFWLQYGEMPIHSIRYDADGRHKESYPDRVIPNEKARLIVKELKG
jgi:hypothetical protein